MNFNIYNILIIAGIIQGFIFTGIVTCNKKFRAKSTFFLVALIFTYSLNNLMYILPDIGVVSLLDMHAYFFFPFASIIAPIIYFYVVYYLNSSYQISIKEKLLFLPFIIFLSIILIIRFQIVFDNDPIMPIHAFYKFIILYHELFAVIFSIVLLILIFNKISKFERTNIKNIKIMKFTDVKWLKTTFYAIFIFTLLWGYLAVRNIFFTNGQTIFYSLWLGMTSLIYWLGHVGIYKHATLISLQKQNIFNARTLGALNKSENEHIVDFENFVKFEKAFLNSNLSLEGVAEHLKLSTGYLSRIIHAKLDTSFTNYIHLLRVEEAKMYLTDPEYCNYSITSIGLEAGFNSRSSFFEVFKKATGKTPLEFRKETSSK